MQDKIIISGMGSISALGSDANEIWDHYQSESTRITNCCFNNTDTPVGKLHPKEEALIKKFYSDRSDQSSETTDDKSISDTEKNESEQK